MICLVLRDPYAFVGALDQGLMAAREVGESLLAVFFIDVEALEFAVLDLTEKGWLGTASRKSLLASMREGYRSLAEDVLAEVRRRADLAGVAVEALVYEGSRGGLMTTLDARGCSRVFSSGSNMEPNRAQKSEG